MSPTTKLAASSETDERAQSSAAADTTHALPARLLQDRGDPASEEGRTIHAALCRALNAPEVRNAIASEMLSGSARPMADSDEYEEVASDADVPELWVVDGETLARSRVISSTAAAEPNCPDAGCEYDYHD